MTSVGPGHSGLCAGFASLSAYTTSLTTWHTPRAPLVSLWSPYTVLAQLSEMPCTYIKGLWECSRATLVTLSSLGMFLSSSVHSSFSWLLSLLFISAVILLVTCRPVPPLFLPFSHLLFTACFVALVCLYITVPMRIQPPLGPAADFRTGPQQPKPHHIMAEREIRK